MVKGISKQVIVVHAPDPKLFDQAIFILKEGALGKDGVTDEELMKEAQKLIRSGNDRTGSRPQLWRYGPVWACGGAFTMGMIWLLSYLL